MLLRVACGVSVVVTVKKIHELHKHRTFLKSEKKFTGEKSKLLKSSEMSREVVFRNFNLL